LSATDEKTGPDPYKNIKDPQHFLEFNRAISTERGQALEEKNEETDIGVEMSKSPNFPPSV
jgi:hypothetical protein